MSLLSRPPRPASGTFPPPVSLIDLKHPEIVQELPDGHQAGAWLLRADAPDTEVTRVAVLAQGWRGGPMETLAQAIIEADPGTVAVVLAQPRINIPGDPRQFKKFVNEVGYASVGRRRMETVSSIGRYVAKEFNLEAIDLYGHSLGGVDVANTAANTGRGFEISNMTLLASAGQLTSLREAAGVVRRVNSSHCPNVPARKSDRRNLPQIATEGANALFQRIGLKLINAADDGISVAGIGFENDRTFPVVDGIIPAGIAPARYTVLRGGDTCHRMPSHPEEAPRIVAAARQLHSVSA